MKVVYARTYVESEREQVKKLYVGYSDDVSLFLNGRILYRGRSCRQRAWRRVGLYLLPLGPG